MRNETIEASGEKWLPPRVEFEWQLRPLWSYHLKWSDPSGAITPVGSIPLKAVRKMIGRRAHPANAEHGEAVRRTNRPLLVGMAGRSSLVRQYYERSKTGRLRLSSTCLPVYTDRQYPRPPRQLGSCYFPFRPLVNVRLSIESDERVCPGMPAAG